MAPFIAALADEFLLLARDAASDSIAQHRRHLLGALWKHLIHLVKSGYQNLCSVQILYENKNYLSIQDHKSCHQITFLGMPYIFPTMLLNEKLLKEIKLSQKRIFEVKNTELK